MKIHAETVGSATPQTPLGCMPQRTFVPITPFQSCCFPKADPLYFEVSRSDTRSRVLSRSFRKAKGAFQVVVKIVPHKQWCQWEGVWASGVRFRQRMMRKGTFSYITRRVYNIQRKERQWLLISKLSQTFHSENYVFWFHKFHFIISRVLGIFCLMKAAQFAACFRTFCKFTSTTGLFFLTNYF